MPFLIIFPAILTWTSGAVEQEFPMMKRMRLLIPAAMITVLMTVPSTAGAAPAVPVYSDDASRVLWFLAVSDDHITARDSDGPARLQWLLSEAKDAIEPDMIFNMGDITDASNGEPLISVYPGQQDDEWVQYQQIIDASGVTTDNYIDLTGNHDQYRDEGLSYYLSHSLAGRTFNRTQHSVVIQKPWGSYHFLGINTAANDGAMFPIDNAGLDVSELVYILRSLEDNANANMTLVFGHHPIVRPDLGFKLSEGSDEVQQMFGDFFVRSYFYGHTHEYRDLFWPDNERMPVTLQENVASFGKDDADYILLGAVDNDNLHVRPFKMGEWPWVIVTTPADINQGGGNPWAYTVPTGIEKAPIRALAFSTDPFLSCQYSLDGGPWVQMKSEGNHTFQGFMNTRGMAAGNHQVEVRALPGPMTGHKITFSVTAYACGDGIDQDLDGYADYPTDPGCDSVTDTDEYNDPIVPEPDAPESVEEAFDIIEEVSIADFTADAVEDAVADVDLDVASDAAQDAGSETVAPLDTGIQTDNLVADPGRIDNGSGEDRGNIIDGTSGDEAINPVKPDGGGCAAAGSGNLSGALFMLLAFVAIIFIRRKVYA